jgi:hypothetical protein
MHARYDASVSKYSLAAAEAWQIPRREEPSSSPARRRAPNPAAQRRGVERADVSPGVADYYDLLHDVDKEEVLADITGWINARLSIR